MELTSTLSGLKRMNKKSLGQLRRLDIKTVRDLLLHFPFRYDDYSRLAKVVQLHDQDIVTVRVRVNLVASRRSWRGRTTITEALVSDETASVRVVWFNQPYIVKNIKPGDELWLSGRVSSDMIGVQFTNPLYEKVGKNKYTSRLIPVYSSTGSLSQKQIRSFISEVLPEAGKLKEWLPDVVLEAEDYAPLVDAIRGIHFPVDRQDLEAALNRLKFDEIFKLQLTTALARSKRQKEKACAITFHEAAIRKFVGSLPFTLTKAQKVAAFEIIRDLEKSHPMNRLLSGDVGSGKTAVAAIAAYSAALSGMQTAVMAPTEILAWQHYETFVKMFGQDANIALLTGDQAKISSCDTVAKKELLRKVAGGEVRIIIGTHALLSAKTEYQQLGLVVVDEQHRFGVSQRQLLKTKNQKKLYPHFLSMTATPIPRSLALSVYGDLDLSVLDELPVGRKTIITRIVSPENRNKAYDFIRGQVNKGRQVFVVCPLIDGTGVKGDKKSVMMEYARLSQDVFKDLKVGYLHGRLPATGVDSKAETMAKFKRGEYDILVSTAVVEVGVDIPNASVMMIEGGERFGLAQLHQFRGRVGRAEHQSYCFVFYGDNVSAETMERLQYFEKHNNGFELAEFDLTRRGPGEVYGVEQSGYGDLKLTKITDTAIIKKARIWAEKIVSEEKEYQQIIRMVDKKTNIHFE